MLYYDVDHAITCHPLFDPLRERHHLNEIDPRPLTAGEEMLGELPIGQRSLNHRDAVGPAFSQLFDEDTDA